MALLNFNLADYINYLSKHGIIINADPSNEDAVNAEMIEILCGMNETEIEHLGKIASEYIEWHPKAAS